VLVFYLSVSDLLDCAGILFKFSGILFECAGFYLNVPVVLFECAGVV
jgi:hypothetical protein